MFQALGTPSRLSSFSRIVLIATPVLMLSRLPGFHLTWIWYLSVTGVTLQMIANLLLLRREFRLRFDTPPAVVNQPSLSA